MRERRNNRPTAPNAIRQRGARRRACSSKRRKPRQRITRWSCFALAGCFLLVALGGAAFYVRLLQGPIDLAFLTPRIASAIDRELGAGIRLEIGGVVLEQGGRTGLTVRLRDLELSGKQGEPMAVISRADVSLDPMALLSGEIAPRRVDLLNPRLHIERDANGRLTMTPDDVDATAQDVHLVEDGGGKPFLTQVDSALLSGLTQSLANAVEGMLSLGGTRGNSLEALSIVDGEISWQGEEGVRRLSDVSARLERGVDGGPVRVEVDAGEGDMRLAFGISAAREAGGRKRVKFELREVPRIPVRLDESTASGLDRLLIPAQATAELVFNAEGGLEEGGGRVRLSARPDRPDSKPVLRDADLLFTLDMKGRRLVLEQSRLAIAEGDGTVSGAILWPESGDVAHDGLAFAFETQDLVLDSNDVDAPPLPVERAEITGAVLPSRNAIRLETLSLRAGAVEIQGAGLLTLGEHSPGLKMNLSTTAMNVPTLKQIWPSIVSPGARMWVMENVLSGAVDGTHFVADYEPDALHNAKTHGVRLPEEALSLSFKMHDVAFTYFRNFPGVRAMNGSATLDGNVFRLLAETGEMVAGDKVIAVEGGSFEVPMIHGESVNGKVQVALAGPTQAFADVMAGDTGMEVPDRLKTLGEVSGDTKLDISLEALLRRDVRREDVHYQIVAEFNDLSIAELIEKRSFAKGSVRLQIAPNDFQISAKGLLDGVATTLDIRSSEPPTDKNLGNYSVSLLIDEKNAARFGLDVSEILVGPTLAQIEGRGSLESIEKVTLDITNAKLSKDGIALKPVGRKGEITFRPVFDASKKQLRDFALTSEDVSLKGNIDLSAEGDFESAEFTNVKMGRGEGASLSLKRNGNMTRVTIRGESFDIAPFLKSAEASGGSRGGSVSGGKSSSGTIIARVDLDRVYGAGGAQIRNAKFRVTARDGDIRNIDGSGRFASGGTLKGGIETDRGGKLVAVTSSDAGALFRFFNFYEKVQGGRLSLKLRLPTKDDQPMPGVLVVDEFRVVDDPGLKKLAATTGSPDQVQTVNTTGAMSFDRLHLVFQRTPGRTRITEGVVRGPAAGATFRGVVDHEKSELNLTGTFVPIYALNNVFSRIPLFGPLLGGRANEGLVGVTFAARGKMSNPNIMVNPLSAIAPGLFRHIFEFGQQPAAANMVRPPGE